MIDPLSLGINLFIIRVLSQMMYTKNLILSNFPPSSLPPDPSSVTKVSCKIKFRPDL